MKKIIKKAAALIIAVSIASGSASCGIKSNEERFDKYLDTIFRELASSSILTQNFLVKDPEAFGIKESQITFGGVAREEGFSEGVRSEIARLEFLFNYDKLRDDQKISYDMLVKYLEVESMSDGLEYYGDYCSGSMAVNTYIPLILAEYRFYNEKNIDEYLRLLDTFDDFFEEVAEFEIEKSKRGLFISDEILDEFIENSNKFIESGEENILILSFDERLSNFGELDDDMKVSYSDKNKKLIKDVIIPAYEKLSGELEKLRGTGTNPGGLAGFDKGKQYYEYIAARDTGSDKTVQEMKEMLEAAISSYSQTCKTLLEDENVAKEVTEAKFEVTEPTEILSTLQSKILKDFPEIPEVNYSVKYVSKFLEDAVNPAFYFSPPVDDTDSNVIYINNSERYRNMELFTTLAHEGYPGHLYQTVYFLSKDPHPLRTVIDSKGYVEGWAQYVEGESYYYGGFSEEAATVLKLDSVYGLLLSAWLDICINYENMGFEDVKKILKESYGIEDEERCRTIYKTLISDPGAYLPYAIGSLEFTQMREYAENALGNKFELKEFHKTVLDLGAVPFGMVWDAVKKYAETPEYLEAV